MENKHSNYDLAQMQSLPLRAKVAMTEQRIRAWYEYWDGNVYVSRSGGKDSDVLGHIVKRLYPDVPQVFVNTGLEFDSVRIHAAEECETVLRQEKSFVQVITEYGYPIISKEVAECIGQIQKCRLNGREPYGYRIEKINGTLINKNTGELSFYNMPKYKYLLDAPFRISNMCCDIMKKIPSKKYEKISGRTPFIGTMASESRVRKTEWMKNGCNAFEKKRPTSQPISFWTEQDILQYIKENDLQIASVYGDIIYQDENGFQYENTFMENKQLTLTGAKRTGCVFCMFGINQDKERFLKLKEIEPMKYDFVMRGGKFDKQGMWIPDKGLGYKFVIDWLNEHGNMGIKY